MQSRQSGTLGTVLKTFVALLAGALVPAILVAALFTVSLVAHQDASQPASAGFLPSSSQPVTVGSLLSSASIVLLFAFAFTAAHVFVLGLPVLLIGLRLRAIRWWSSLLAGFVIGYLPTAWADNWATPLDYSRMGALGAIGALTFWLIWRFWAKRTHGAGPGMSAAPASGPTI